MTQEDAATENRSVGGSIPPLGTIFKSLKSLLVLVIWPLKKQSRIFGIFRSADYSRTTFHKTLVAAPPAAAGRTVYVGEVTVRLSEDVHAIPGSVSFATHRVVTSARSLSSLQ
jgi:hypothetical protein